MAATGPEDDGSADGNSDGLVDGSRDRSTDGSGDGLVDGNGDGFDDGSNDGFTTRIAVAVANNPAMGMLGVGTVLFLGAGILLTLEVFPPDADAMGKLAIATFASTLVLSWALYRWARVRAMETTTVAPK